jgi:MATE family multidrug resistance protein
MATAAAEWYRVVVYAAIMFRLKYLEAYGLTDWQWNWPLMRRLWRFGGPSGLQWFMEATSFTLFLVLVGRLGKIELAGTTLAFNVNSVAWVPMMGLGLAVSTMVGQQLGRNRPDMAARATWTSLTVAMLYMDTLSLFYVLVPDWFLKGHAAGMSPENFLPLRNLIVVLLRFVAVYCLFDAMNMVFVSAIRGAGDMRFVLKTTLVMSIAPLVAAWWGVTLMGWGLLWCWTVLTLWVCLLGIIYLARFLQGKWKAMRVIEPRLPDAR